MWKLCRIPTSRTVQARNLCRVILRPSIPEPAIGNGFVVAKPPAKRGKLEKMPINELVRKEGFEPPRPFGHKILSLARLPVPPLPRWSSPIYRESAPGRHIDD